MILFIQAKNTGRTITEKGFSKNRDRWRRPFFGYISEKEITAIAGHPAVKGMEVQVSEKEGGHRLTAFVYLRSDRNIKKSVDNILGDLGIKNLSWQVNRVSVRYAGAYSAKERPFLSGGNHRY